MRYKEQICFTHRYSKLSKKEFDTIRWLDTIYVLGRVYPCFFVAQNSWHGHYALGDFRLTKLEIVRLGDLDYDFITADSDLLSRSAYFEMMEAWYSRKPDWKGEDSEVQKLHLVKVK